MSSTELLDLEAIRAFHLDRDERRILPLFKAAGTDPARIFEIDNGRFEDADRVRYFMEGAALSRSAYHLAVVRRSDELMEMAIRYADFLLQRFTQPDGHFVEYEKCPWVEPENLWYTTPWGTAFHGNAMVDTYQLLCGDLSLEQRDRWEASLRKTGGWLYKNPIIGPYVFNCGIDLLRLLWRIGDQIDMAEWKTWGMTKAHELIRRDVDEAGWIHGEAGGVSGAYQLVGTNFLSEFAWESGDPVLVETSHRLIGVLATFGTPTLFWNGNFGTRSNSLGHVGGRNYVLVDAALGNPVAAHFLRRYGHPSMNRDLELWKAALATPEEAPVFGQVVDCPGIESTVVREGSFQAWFCNYKRSIWAKGFTGLWVSEADEAIFSTLHSLPSRVEKAKLRLGDTEDWAGFPHVIVECDGVAFHSQQGLRDLKVTREDGVVVAWQEDLISGDGETGGKLSSRYRFKDNAINMALSLESLAGKTCLDFHVLRKKDQYYTLWTEAHLAEIREDRLLTGRGGMDLVFGPEEMKTVGVQMGNIIYCFTLVSAPKGCEVNTGMLKQNGLHTGNHGGVRVRVALPENVSEAEVEVRFEVMER